MANTYTTTLDGETYKAVQEIKRLRGVTGGQLIRLGLKAISEGNPLKKQVYELEDGNKKLQAKISQLAMKLYQFEEKQAQKELELLEKEGKK